MSLTAKTRHAGNVSIVELNGKLTLGENTLVLRDELKSLLAEGRRNIVVNMAGVSYIDSAGLGELVAKFTTASRDGGAVKLLHVQAKMKSLLQMTNLTTIFPVFDDEQSAIGSFGSSATA